MILAIDQSKSDPLYLQIRAQIILAIAQGELKPGDTLPSVRKLASDLGINLHTVNKAYAVLQDEGYVYMRGRKGTAIADMPQPFVAPTAPDADAALQEALGKAFCEYLMKGGSPQRFIQLAAQAASDGPSKTID